jgi:multidrug resistance protein, MATE family
MDAAVNSDGLKVGTGYRQILKIALPVTLALIVPQLNFITNNIFIGQLGVKELGNAGITGVFYLILAVMGNGFNNGLQSLISRSAGSGDTAAISAFFSQGLRMVAQFALGAIIFTWFLAPLCLKPFIAAENIQVITDFLKIRVMGLPFLFAFQLCNAFLVGTLNSRYLMIGTIIEAGLNILLDYLLIFGHWGLPAMGFNGAALASAIAEALGLVAVLVVIYRLKLKQRFDLFRSFRFQKPLSRKLLMVSIPLVIQYFISLVTWLIFFLMIESYGDVDKAISNVMRNVFGFTGIFAWAFASTSNTMVANLIGQGLQNKVIPTINRIALMSICATAIMALLLNIFPHTFFGMFGENTEFVERAIPVMRMVSAAMLCMSISTTWLNGLTGTGKTTINLITEVVAITLYIAYTTITMKVYHVSLAMAWSNELVYWISMFTIAFLYMRSGKWKKNGQM